MTKRLALCGIVWLLGLQSAVANEKLAERIEVSVSAGFSGQIVISNADGILYTGSFGMADREAGVPVTENTLFDIGSITKTYPATALLLLAAQDKVRLDMTLSDWFAACPLPPERSLCTSS